MQVLNWISSCRTGIRSVSVILAVIASTGFVLSQNNDQPRQPRFYVSLTGVPPFSIVDGGATSQLTITWTSDTCAGTTISGVGPVPVNGFCRDGGNNIVVPEGLASFPNGLQALRLQRGAGTNSLTSSGDANANFDLLRGVANNAAFAGVTRNVTISNLRQFPTDYYTIVIAARDANGNLVQGQSQPFGIQNGGNLPTLNTLQLISPLPGSFWLAGGKYRIRFEALPTGIVPDRYHIDLLTVDGLVVSRLQAGAIPLANDDLFGTSRPLNYTLWDIDPALQNQRFKLRVTGVYSQGRSFANVTNPPVVESGIFFVGPVKPDL